MTNQQTDKPAQRCGTCKHFRQEKVSIQGRCKIADTMERELRAPPRPSALHMPIYSAWMQTYNGMLCPLWERGEGAK